MTITYEDVNPTLIPNTTMQKFVVDGNHRSYYITPVEGYVLHDSSYDALELVTDEITGEEIEVLKFGYRRTTASCGRTYDFATSTVTDENGNTFTAYGTRQFFAVPESDVPADSVFGVITPPEIMSTEETETE